MQSRKEYGYNSSGELGHHHDYLLPSLLRAVKDEGQGRPTRIFDLGCGNGSVAGVLVSKGHQVVGVDPSESGIAAAAGRRSEGLRLEVGSAYDPLAEKFGTFPIVISLEVVEHVYSPREFAKSLFDLVQENGLAVVSTPYHGYLKNLVLALTGAMDRHFTALWDHGHIKFWSPRTLSALLLEAGFKSVEIQRVGRVPPLAKSMIALARK
ncbi:class I SAM-dependent methyltransferase [Labrys monachus]|uniref:2-polyprenyl-6-hydroxyphenyl methylase/3-demethylubiquinone-9 3-methyltransferase n=1 Tax=Labrys monachus TaxID=217067 RepID=A0ABU0FJI3_9HYPH|nr:methyltransferase domain-containing protein [Labrys monachus]MDQ0394768.1 2-polyprenyl-6-hydroxyphenyl methylase/3-demethylubiquinone-9 3-methyltransferase [Labrys monachus]